jgi:hypothetical protein
MADKRISQLVDRGTVVNSDVVPIVVSGAVTTNKATISSIQTFMQGNLDLGVTSVGITFGTSGTDINASGSPVTSSGNITINLPTASATNRGALSSADWSTFNGKQPAGNYVTLDTVQTITAQKTFTTSGGSDSVIITTTGAGFALDAIKAGNGEVIRVNKTSGTGNAMTVIGGNFEAPTIVKTGGTSSQFLKADGSVDSSTYLTTGSAGTTYVPYTGAGANVDLGVYNITSSAVNVNGSGSNAGVINLESNTIFPLVNGYGTIGSGTTNQFNFYQTTGAGVFRGAILSLNSITASVTRTFTLPDADGTLSLTSDLGAYLPLAGGTLTGALNGTTATFTGAVSGSAVTITATTGIAGDFTNNSTTNETLRARNNGSGNIAAFRNASAEVASITNSGGLTLSGALNGTSASFTSTVYAATLSQIGSAVAGQNVQLNINGVSGKAQRIEFQNSGVQQWLLGAGAASETTAFELFNSTGVITLSINKSTNAATFSSTVETTGIKFPAVQVASADANTLDDYEEGTWTPTLTDNTNASVYSSGLKYGFYTKVGRVVTATAVYDATTCIAGSSIKVGGLPFTVTSSVSRYPGFNSHTTGGAISSTTIQGGYAREGETNFQLIQRDSSSTVNFIAGTFSMFITIIYVV